MRREVRERSESTPSVIRGGISFGAVLTGVVVAFGSMMTFAVLIGLAMAIGGYEFSDLTPTSLEVGLGLGVGLVLSQLLSYMWGGYTASRMGRGEGVANGILVPAVALIIGAIVAGGGALFRGQPRFEIPFITGRSLDIGSGTLMDTGLILGGASILAMFLAGLFGGILGNKWHARLESDSFDEATTSVVKELKEPRPSLIDLSEKDRIEAGPRTTAARLPYPNPKKG